MRVARHHGLRRAGASLVLGSLMLTGFAVLAASSSDTNLTASMTVNRVNKGDQLQAPATVRQLRPPAAAKTGRPPFGCDPSFSAIAEPALARTYYRCAA